MLLRIACHVNWNIAYIFWSTNPCSTRLQSKSVASSCSYRCRLCLSLLWEGREANQEMVHCTVDICICTRSSLGSSKGPVHRSIPNNHSKILQLLLLSTNVDQWQWIKLLSSTKMLKRKENYRVWSASNQKKCKWHFNPVGPFVLEASSRGL